MNMNNKLRDNKFGFYEVVEICSDKKNLQSINGKLGTILGMTQNDDGPWGYAVTLDDAEEGWDIKEEVLISKGIFRKREDFYDADSITVVVDPKNLS